MCGMYNLPLKFSFNSDIRSQFLKSFDCSRSPQGPPAPQHNGRCYGWNLREGQPWPWFWRDTKVPEERQSSPSLKSSRMIPPCEGLDCGMCPGSTGFPQSPPGQTWDGQLHSGKGVEWGTRDTGILGIV